MKMDQDINKRVEKIRKTILTLEWDMPYIENKDLKVQKEWILNQYKKELKQLLEKKGIQT